jgi:hypothetical protein
MINFVSCFIIGKVHGWGTFSKCEAGLGTCLVLGSLFREKPHPRALSYTKIPRKNIAPNPQKLVAGDNQYMMLDLI